MRVTLLLSTDDRVVSVTGNGQHIAPNLVPGVHLGEVALLGSLRSVVDDARAGRPVSPTCVFAGQTWDVAIDVTTSGSFVTLEPLVVGSAQLELIRLVLSGQPVSRALDELCRLWERRLPGMVGSVLILGEDGLLHVASGPSLPATLKAAGSNLVPSAEKGTPSAAVFFKRPVFSDALRSDASWAELQDVVASSGIRCCWSWPILTRENAVVGSVAMYGFESRLPTHAQCALVETMIPFAALSIQQWRSERTNREMLERYHLAAEASSNVIYDWNLRSNTLEWSPRITAVFGYEHAPHSFDWWESCVHPADRERVADQLHQTITERRKSWHDTYRFRRRDGSWATVVDHGIVLFGEDGAPVRLIGELSDVSGQQQLQNRLALSERLASVGTLAAGVAHEINNPLAWITSNVHYATEELARLASDPSVGAAVTDVMEALTDARTGAERVSTIVRDLKLFSRGKDEARGIVDVRQVLESAMAMARNEIRHRARLQCHFERTSSVKADEGKLSQVFLNLLINAAHAVPEGEASKHVISVSTHTTPSSEVVVTISDSGAGISPDVLPHIFDPFFTTKPVGQGTGLGLSICHSIVSSLGGSISVQSTLGKGTAFRVSLPAASGEVRASSNRVPPPNDTVRGVVAIIDDEASVLMAMRRVLGQQHEVHEFNAPAVALDQIPALNPEVIFCDVMMPDMSGGEFFRRLQVSAPRLAQRVIFMTGGAFSAAGRAFLGELTSPVLEKPFSAERVRRLASEQISKTRASG